MILHGADILLPASIVVDQAIGDALITGANREIEFFSEDLDALRLPGAGFEMAFVEYLRKDDLRASEVIRHIRELLREHEIQLKPLDLNEVTPDVLQMVNGEARRQGVEIEKQFSAVRGDAVHLQQILLNLVLNGMEAMSELAESNRRLIVRTSGDRNGNIEVAVADSGPGIPPGQLPRLFDSCFTTKKNGMGLGLSIARSIIEAHGGNIWAENNSKSRACIRFTLPVNGKHAATELPKMRKLLSN
jgi:signal transduction histidine kinase